MARSQNGYPANDINLTSVRTIPGTARKIRLRKGAAGDLLLWVLGQFDALVEDLDAGQLDDWGYAERPIRGGTELSNHASGTAADANAVRHPLGTAPSATFSTGQITTIRAIVARTEGCVRWGGDYSGRKDPMHFEIVASEERCATVLDKLTAPSTPGGGGSTPTPTPTEIGVELMERRTLPASPSTTAVRLLLSGSRGAALIVRPRINGNGVTEKPVWQGNIYAWGSDKVGVGGNPLQQKGFNPKTVSHRRYDLPGAVWADFEYSSNADFEIDIVG